MSAVPSPQFRFINASDPFHALLAEIAAFVMHSFQCYDRVNNHRFFDGSLNAAKLFLPFVTLRGRLIEHTKLVCSIGSDKF